MSLGIISLSIFIAVATATPVLRHQFWWIRIFEFPRVQLGLLALIGMFGAIFYADGFSDITAWAGVLLAVCAGYQLWQILPYTKLWPKQVQQASTRISSEEISVLVGNVLMTNRRVQDFLALVEQKDPDIVLAVETNQWWESKMEPLSVRYRYCVKHPLDNFYGMHLYSRLELKDPNLAFLVEDNVPSIHARVVLPSGHHVEIHCLHPAPPSPTENKTSVERDAELLVVAQTLDAARNSIIVLGDLNDVAWSETTRLFRKTSQLLDPRIGRGMFNTFHAKLPFLRWPLDHVFHSADFKLVSMERLGDFGSDHFPIFACLQRQENQPRDHNMPSASVKESALVEEKIDNADIDRKAAESELSSS